MKRIHVLIALLMISGSAVAQKYVGTYRAPVAKAATGPAILETKGGNLRIPNFKHMDVAAQRVTWYGQPARIVKFDIQETINKLNKLAKLGQGPEPFFSISKVGFYPKTSKPKFVLQIDKSYLPSDQYNYTQGWGPNYVNKPIDLGETLSFELDYEIQQNNKK